MARRKRFCPAGLPQHVIQRVNNRQLCFGSDEDFAVYARCLKEYADKFGVAVHAWVFMSNHVHLLVTPQSDDSVSLMMQSLGRRYVQYFNRTYCRTGTLWEGRFKSCIVQEDGYLLHCYRYIELNPVRANMVADPAEYIWSSYRINALGARSNLCSPHEVYLALGRSLLERLSVYRGLFQAQVDKALCEDIRLATGQGLVLGSERFKEQLEALFGQKLRSGRAGRPPSLA